MKINNHVLPTVNPRGDDITYDAIEVGHGSITLTFHECIVYERYEDEGYSKFWFYDEDGDYCGEQIQQDPEGY